MYTQTYNLYLFHEVRLKSSFCFPPFALLLCSEVLLQSVCVWGLHLVFPGVWDQEASSKHSFAVWAPGIRGGNGKSTAVFWAARTREEITWMVTTEGSRCVWRWMWPTSTTTQHIYSIKDETGSTSAVLPQDHSVLNQPFCLINKWKTWSW